MTISLRKRLDSHLLDLPELRPMIGKDVRIIVVEEPSQPARPDLSALHQLAGRIDLDDRAIEELPARRVVR